MVEIVIRPLSIKEHSFCPESLRWRIRQQLLADVGVKYLGLRNSVEFTHVRKFQEKRALIFLSAGTYRQWPNKGSRLISAARL